LPEGCLPPAPCEHGETDLIPLAGWYARIAEAFDYALFCGDISMGAGPPERSVPRYCKPRIEGQPGPNRGPSLLQPTEKRRRGREIEMGHRIVAVGDNGSPKPGSRLLISAEDEVRKTGEH